MDFIQIGTRIYHRDLHALIKQNGDMIQRDGIWQPIENPKYIYLYRQVVEHGEITYYYTDVSSVDEIQTIVNSEIDPLKRNFGEVVLHGQLYCMVLPPHDEYADVSSIVYDVLRKYVKNDGGVTVSHTKYIGSGAGTAYYIFRATTKNGKNLYWKVDDMKKIIDAVCHYVDCTSGQFYSIYHKVDEFTLKSSLCLNIYSPMQHMTLPGCINIEQSFVKYSVQEVNNSRCINFNTDSKWEKGVLNSNIPTYDHSLPISTKEIFDKVMHKYVIRIIDSTPWIGEFMATADICPISGNDNCKFIIRLTPQDIKIFCNCIVDEKYRPTYKVLHTFEKTVIQPAIEYKQVIETFEEYLDLNHHTTKYSSALLALKQVLVYDITAQKIAIKKRNISTSVIYWDYWNSKEFFAKYRRKVKNCKGEFELLESIIEGHAHEFSAKIVWVPYSWKYKPADFEKYSECVNQYPVPPEPQTEVYFDKFKTELISLFSGNERSAYIYTLFMAMIVQKPHNHRKIHLILRNVHICTIVEMFILLLGKEVVYVTDVEHLDNVPRCTLCIIKNYKRINNSTKTRSTASEFFQTRVFNRLDWCANPGELYNTCYAISLYDGDDMPARQLDESCDEIIVNMAYSRKIVNMGGAYEYLLSIDETNYERIEEHLSSSTSITHLGQKMVSCDNTVLMYIKEITSKNRGEIICGSSHSISDVYSDYVKYAKSVSMKPYDKNNFGRILKSKGICRKQCKIGNSRPYKYVIPNILDI